MYVNWLEKRKMKKRWHPRLLAFTYAFRCASIFRLQYNLSYVCISEQREKKTIFALYILILWTIWKCLQNYHFMFDIMECLRIQVKSQSNFWYSISFSLCMCVQCVFTFFISVGILFRIRTVLFISISWRYSIFFSTHASSLSSRLCFIANFSKNINWIQQTCKAGHKVFYIPVLHCHLLASFLSCVCVCVCAFHSSLMLIPRMHVFFISLKIIIILPPEYFLPYNILSRMRMNILRQSVSQPASHSGEK